MLTPGESFDNASAETLINSALSLPVAAGWWRAYGLLYDPFRNAPVPRGDSETLVLTPAVEELESYFHPSEATGRIFLVCGEYGSGKTSALNAIETMTNSEASSFTVIYEDLSKSKSREKLSTLFRDVAKRAEDLLGKGRTPVFALDQLHQLKPGLMEEFFTAEQTAFEALKARGVNLVFAGDSRFRSLVRTAGPLGAIFDREFPLPPFEDELATEMITRLLNKAGDEVDFPFTEAAIREIVRQAKGVPRHIVEICGQVMRHASSQTRPIVIDLNEVKAATAELTDEALAVIRDQLRSPSINNCLAKLGKMHSRSRGHEKIHEAGRLLDIVLEKPGRLLEDVAGEMGSLKLRPDVVIESLMNLGLLESEEERRKGAYGSTTHVVHRPTKPAIAILADIRERTGLTPSQYFHRVSADASPIRARSGSDLLQVDLEALRDSLPSSRARTFLERAIRSAKLAESPDAREEDYLSAFENFLRALSLSILNVVRADWLELVGELVDLLKIAEPDKHKVIGGCERLVELGTIYRERGVDWNRDTRGDASGALRSVLQLLSPAALSVLASGQDPVAEKSVQQALAKNHEELQRLLEKAEKIKPTKDNSTPKVAHNLASELDLDFGHMQAVIEILEGLDSLTYLRAIEHDKEWHVRPFFKVLRGLQSKDLDQFASSFTLGCKLLNQLAEQGPDIVSGSPQGRRFGTVMQACLSSESEVKSFKELKKFHASPAEPEMLQKALRFRLVAIREATSSKARSDAALHLWYLLRNVDAHMLHSLPLNEVSKDLMQSFCDVVFCLSSSAFEYGSYGKSRLAIIDHPASRNVAWINVDDTRLLGLIDKSVSPGSIVRIKTAEPQSKGHPCRVLEACTWDSLLRAHKAEFEGLPQTMREAIRYMRLTERTKPTLRSALAVFQLRLNSNRNACVNYGQDQTPCLVRFPEEHDVREDVQEAAANRLYIVGLPYPRGGDRGVNVIPVVIGYAKKHLEVAHKALLSPPPANPTTQLTRRDEFAKPWKFTG